MLAGSIRRRKELLSLLALLVTLAGPFLMRPADSTVPLQYDRRLVILSPHHEDVRKEFGRAFAKSWKAKTNETLYVDWRIPGGSSEIAMFLRSEFTSAFRYYWERRQGRTWTQEVAATFASAQGPSVSAAGTLGPGHEARRRFLESEVGIGVDLLFGGGSYDFQQHADAGFLVAKSKGGQLGPASVRAKHPDWFNDQVIPASVSGEPFRDRDDRWVGAALSSFGIVYNRDVLRRLSMQPDLVQWSELGDPKLAGQLALSDPTKSGSAAKAFELIIQQQMHRAVSQLSEQGGGSMTPREIEAEGVRRGWEAGFQLIQAISANARYFTDSATKIPREVARGDAAAGMAIDLYGRATQEYVRRPDGWSRVGFVAPLGGTSVSVDPIGMLRGARDPELATAFIEFVLSSDGQKLWNFRAGTPGGPTEKALRRLPVRKDFYTDENRPFMADGDEEPYLQAESFTYRPEWTQPAFGAIRFLIRVMCADTHHEQKRAWRALIEHGFPPHAAAAFHDLSRIGYDEALGTINTVLRGKDKVQQVRLARELADAFRKQYSRAYELAVAGATQHE